MSLPDDWKIKRLRYTNDFDTVIEIDKDSDKFYFSHDMTLYGYGGDNVTVNFDVPIKVIIEILKGNGYIIQQEVLK